MAGMLCGTPLTDKGDPHMDTPNRRKEIVTGLVGDTATFRDLFLQSASFRHRIETLAAALVPVVDMIAMMTVDREEHIAESITATEGEGVAQRIRALGGLMDPEALAALQRELRRTPVEESECPYDCDYCRG